MYVCMYVCVCISGVGELDCRLLRIQFLGFGLWVAGCGCGGGCFFAFGLILKFCGDGNNGTIIEITVGGVVMVWYGTVWYVVWAVVV
ncbi:hypothetical protein BZA77DRAFT_320085 [Pyronema omphalodes]|nr:hypothetical protein BZA77DRAFT_320085 [Pyronema omphalodes]